MVLQINTSGNTWNSEEVEYCIRLGRENNYYEIRHPFLYNNSLELWDSVNVNLENLSRYKYDNISTDVIVEKVLKILVLMDVMIFMKLAMGNVSLLNFK